MGCNCGPLIKAIDAYIKKADGDLSDVLEEAGFIDPDGTVREISGLEEKIAAILTTETDYFLAALKEAVDIEEFLKDSWPKLKAGDVTAQALFEAFWEEFESYMRPLASEYIARTDADLTVEAVSKYTTDWVKSWSGTLAEKMQLDGQDMIESILTSGLEEGKGIDEVAKDILDSGIRDEFYRARRTAITEVLRAHSAASHEAMMQSPAVEEKEWRHTGSYRTTPRPNHMDISGQRVPKGKPFTLKGADGVTYHPQYPRDATLPAGESVNCHCIHQAIVSQDVLGLDIEERRRLQAEAVREWDAAWEAEQSAI